MDSEYFINEVAKYECIYKIKSDDYKNREKKDIPWNRIAFVMKTDVLSCQKRWRTIRDSFSKEIKAEETRSGDGAKKRKAWHLMPYLKFLRQSNEARPSISSHKSLHSPSSCSSESIPVVRHYSQSQDVDPFSLSPFMTYGEHSYSTSGKVQAMVQDTPPTSLSISTSHSTSSNCSSPLLLDVYSPSPSSNHEKIISQTTISPPVSTPQNRKSNNKTKRQKIETSLEKERDELMQALNKIDAANNKQDYTPTEHFLLSLAPNLDRMEPAKRERIKLQFQTILVEEEFGV